MDTVDVSTQMVTPLSTDTGVQDVFCRPWESHFVPKDAQLVASSSTELSLS